MYTYMQLIWMRHLRLVGEKLNVCKTKRLLPENDLREYISV